MSHLTNIKHLLFYILSITSTFSAVINSPAYAKLNIKEVEEGVVRVISAYDEDNFSTGSGFLINPTTIITNKHVTEDAKLHLIMFKGHTDDPIQVTKVVEIPGKDLAILTVPALQLTPVTLSQADIEKGQTVFALGYPGQADKFDAPAGDPTISDGVISRFFMGTWEKASRVDTIQHTAEISSGNSGGPLLDSCGRVIGVNTSVAMRSAKTYDANGKVTGVAITQGIGTGYSSNISELIKELKRAGIEITNEDNEPCIEDSQVQQLIEETNSTVAQNSQASQNNLAAIGDLIENTDKLTSSIKRFVLWGAVLSFILIFTLLLVLKKPREKVIEVVKEVSLRSHRRVGRDEIGSSSASRQKLVYDQLELRGKDYRGQEVVFRIDSDTLKNNSGFSLGRHPDLNHKQLNDDDLSRRHCRFNLSDKQFYVEDLNSSNGTYLNSEQLGAFDPRMIKHGDKLKCGSFQFSVYIKSKGLS